MSVEAPGRRASVRVCIGGADVTERLLRHLISMKCTDNDEDEADDLELVLQDRGGLWSEEWLTDAVDAAAGVSDSGGETGLEISAAILVHNWRNDGKTEELDCGSYTLDSVEYTGPPAVLTMRATSLTFASQIRQTRKSKAWESYYLSGIAGEMAESVGMSVQFLAERDPYYEREEQYKESDIAFLKRLCHNAGLSLKSYDKTLVLFDQRAYEAREPAVTIRKRTEAHSADPERDYLSWNFQIGTADTQYTSCRVSYYDPETGATIEGIAWAEDYDAEKDKNDQRLEITAKVSTEGEALALAGKLLRLHNKLCRTVEFVLPGNPALAAGMTIRLAGWGGWDGKYIITQAAHTVDGEGFVTQITARRVIEGY